MKRNNTKLTQKSEQARQATKNHSAPKIWNRKPLTRSPYTKALYLIYHRVINWSLNQSLQF